ncbi:hypothetical protein ES703_88183 [subsurface metagenome]
MKLEKAIEMLSLKPIIGDKSLEKDMTDAMSLGKEALKVFQRRRKNHAVTGTGLLPGETVD